MGHTENQSLGGLRAGRQLANRGNRHSSVDVSWKHPTQQHLGHASSGASQSVSGKMASIEWV